MNINCNYNYYLIQKFQPISFGNNRAAINTLAGDEVCIKGSYWSDFINKFQQVYKGISLEQEAYNMTSKEENKLGEGAKKIVYSIDGIDDYVIARLKKTDESKGTEFVESMNPYTKYNFSQPVAQNNEFMIMRKIKGTPHSLSDWTIQFRSVVYDNKSISNKDARGFLAQMERIAEFPIESYIDLANQVKYLNDKNIKIDMFNPNNILVDDESKKFTYFDLFEKPENFYFLKPNVNCVQDMINILTDALLHSEYIDSLGDEDAEKLKEATVKVIDKCNMAGKTVGLCDDSSVAERTYKYVQNNLIKRQGRNPKYMECYTRFKHIYN